MTWILGRTTVFGYAVALSDIRVTFTDGSERDCLRKIHFVGPVMALGFAGSVAIGFAMVNRLTLTELLRGAGPSGAWDPTIVSQWWQADARAVFDGFGPEERRLQSHLMLIATHPTENSGDVGLARCYVYRFMSPDFSPVQALHWEIVSIGSGTLVEHYRQRLETLGNSDKAIEIDMLYPGAGILGPIEDAIDAVPVCGISCHLHVCVVQRGQVSIGPNDRRYVGRPSTEHFVMPQVASSLDELNVLLGGAGVGIEGAEC